jgi:hypothetical protein
VEARPDREAGIIWFVIDLRSAKEHEIARDPAVGLVFIDADAKAYLSITEEAAIRRDRAEKPKSGSAPTMCGGADRRIVTFACCKSRPSLRSCGMGPRARRLRFSNSPRRGSPV